MCADAGRRIESERRPFCFVVFSKKQRFYMLFSFLSKCGTLYLVIIFCIIEYKNRCVRIKAPHICPDPRRHGIRVSPAAADTVPVLAAALPHIPHPFPEYMRPRFLWMEYYCRFFLCQRAAPPAQEPEIHKRLRLLMICLFISCLQSCSFHICCLHKNLCPCVATFLSLPEIILRLYIK